MSIASIVMVIIGIFLYTVLTDLNFLLLIIVCLCGSYVIQARMQNVSVTDSIIGCVSIIVIIVGVIVACFGTFLLPLDPNLALNGAIYHQNSTTVDVTQTNPENIINSLALGLGVIGFGIALFTYGLSNLSSLQSQYEFTELKVYIMKGPPCAQKYMRELKPKDLIWIFGFWAIIGIIIIILNYFESQSSGFASIRCFIGFILILIGIIITTFGHLAGESSFSEMVQRAKNLRK